MRNFIILSNSYRYETLWFLNKTRRTNQSLFFSVVDKQCLCLDIEFSYRFGVNKLKFAWCNVYLGCHQPNISLICWCPPEHIRITLYIIKWLFMYVIDTSSKIIDKDRKTQKYWFSLRNLVFILWLATIQNIINPNYYFSVKLPRAYRE